MSVKAILRIVATAVVTALFAFLVFVIVSDYSERSEANNKAALLEKELISSGLVSEKIKLEREIAILSDKEADRLPTVTFLFREPNNVIFESIRPLMTLFDMRATIAISPGAMPGDEGMLSVEQYRAMLADGYASSLLYDGSSELSAYLSLAEQQCEALEIDLPTVLYVCGTLEEDTVWLTEYDTEGKPIFTNELDSILEKYGIGHVVQETYQTKLVAYEELYEPLVYCEALGYNAMNAKIGRLASGSLYETIKRHAAVVYSVNFDFHDSHGAFYGEYDPTLSSGDGTTTDDFARMLGAIADYGSNVKITDVAGVAAYRAEFNERLQLDSEIDIRLEVLHERLDEVNLAIEAMKDKYK